MAIKVGINGFGRIGRNVLRASLGDPEIDFVAVNDITDTKTLAHLLKYDSILGNLEHDIRATENGISVEGDEFRVFSEKDPAKINWESVGAQVVVESTGRFTKAEDARKHLRGPVKKVIISAPAKNEDITIVLGVNEGAYDPAAHNIISNASCTTNCLAPVAKVIHENFRIRSAQMTTIHSYTNDQELRGILGFSEEPLVSVDFRKNDNSSIVDAEYTKVIGGRLVKVLSWYDNEWGYSCRVRDLIKFIAQKGL